MNRLLFLLPTITLFYCSSPQHTSENKIEDKESFSIPIRLHPKNPHYFQFKGNPLLLITSAEHYGQLLNRAFDYKKYLETLAAEGMNYTRIFAGTWAGFSPDFWIKYTPLAPKPEDFLTPWAYTRPENDGKKMYDLNIWNEVFFKRMHDIFRLAARKDIIIELTLFCSCYNDEYWQKICPENPRNNVNIKQPLDFRIPYTLKNGELLGFQEKFVRKVVNELNEYDNFFFEIQNEPWADRNIPVLNIVNEEELIPRDWNYKADLADEASLAWQDTIAGFITDEESRLDKKHLIAQNYGTFKIPLANVSDKISIINFHYAWPEAAWWNYNFNRVIGFDESGFAGTEDKAYRRQAWKFILSGGGLFNNLDYSFFTGYEDGTLNNTTAPGGGSKSLRKQLSVLNHFIHGFDILNMKPDFCSVIHAPGMIPFVLSNKGEEYAIFLLAVNVEKSKLRLEMPDGIYKTVLINTLTGEIIRVEEKQAENNYLILDISFVDGEVALKINRI
jgi:hypothetical protein